MSNWDDEDWEEAEAQPTPSSYKNSESLGDWDDEDAEEEEEPELKKAPAPMKPSKARAQALKAKEEEERQKEIERILAREKQLNDMSAVERRMAQQQIVEEADLENAKDLFMVGDGADKDGMAPPAEPTIENFKPVTDADYSKFAKMVGERCTILNNNPRKTGRYVEFVKELMRHFVKDLGPDDTKDLATFMGVLGNEKRDEFKKSKGIKKKVNKKSHVRVDKADDMRDDNYDDFGDDFM